MSSCKKNKDFESYVNFTNGTVTVSCNQELSATPKDDNIPNFMEIYGKASNNSIRMTLHNFTNQPGEFVISQLHKVNVYINGKLYVAAYDIFTNTTVGSGKIIFTEVSKDHVKGTFAYIVKGDVGLTENITGEFNVKRNW